MKHPQRALVAFMAVMAAASLHAITVQIVVQSPAYCVNPTGALSVYVFGGVGPYTYSWSTGGTMDTIWELPAGTYSVTVTDANLDQATAEMTLASEPYPPHYATWLPGCPLAAEPPSPPYRLVAQAYPSNSGIPPYTYSGTPWVNGYTLTTQGYSMHYIQADYDPGTPVSVVITDASGCTSTLNTITPAPPQFLEPQVLEVNGACSGGSNGSIRVFVPAEPSGWPSSFTLYTSTGTLVQWTTGNLPVGQTQVEFTCTGMAAGTYYMVARPTWEQLVPPGWQEQWFPELPLLCPDTTVVVVPALGYTCGTLSGRVYVDANENCVQAYSEPGLPSTVVEVQPGNYYTLTNASGNYSINLPYGTYTVADQNPLFQEHCGVEGTPFNLTLAQPNVVRNLADTSLVGLDVSVGIGSGAARPGFQVGYGLLVRNHTGVLSGAGTVSFTFSAPLTYVQASPAPTSINGTTLTWNMASLNAFQQRSYNITLQVPPDIGLLGTELAGSATVTVANTDVDLTNNTDSHLVTVTGAYDPNDKLASTTAGVPGEYVLDTDGEIEYTIRFQNTGTDTAFFVVITDTLPPTLDPATFRAGVASHTHTLTMQGNGVLRWMFPNILLPDSNVNELRSHGFVTFHISPHEPLLPGTAIGNTANIYFDYNPPVITEPCMLVVTVPPVLLEVSAVLAGPYNSTTGLMDDQLRAAGSLPLMEPYAGLGYAHVDGGGESTTAEVMAVTGPQAVVDWVVLELRSTGDPAQVLHTRSALLRRDGQVVEVDGVSPVAFNALAGPYHVAIRHRNHLGCMSALPSALSSTAAAIDLTAAATTTWGTDARKEQDGIRMLWPGDVNFDGTVKYTGDANDRDPVLLAIGGVVPTNAVPSGYTGMDVSMNAVTRYAGGGNDRDMILQTIGGVTPTAVRVAQLP